jgi:hypothetical protein
MLRLILVLPFVLFACADSHGMDDDAGTDASMLDATPRVDAGLMQCLHDGPHPQCTAECGGALIEALCIDDNWICPPGSIDIDTCDRGCPDGINPWDRDVPNSACSVEGATCSEGTQCGSAMFCTCESGSWNCGVAEPDPVCWCEREPVVGDPCSDESIRCGECCPTLDGPGWAPMVCSGGTWQPRACEELACPEILLECPVEIEPLLGTACVHEAQSCGDACCGSVQCRDGLWVNGPALGCACFPSPACGTGRCTLQQSCNSECGPAGGFDFRCVALPADCNNCECVSLEPGQSCELVDGHVHVTEDELCF